MYNRGEYSDLGGAEIKTAPLLGVQIAVGNRSELLAAAASGLGVGGAISTVNPIMLSGALKDERLFSALSGSLNIPDGHGVARAFAKRGIHTQVLPGVELAEELLSLGSFSLGIIGGKAGVAALAMAYLRAVHSKTRAAFVKDGYTYNKEELARLLTCTRPDIVFVCLGTPAQEILISELLPYSPRTLFLGLGGSADIYSGVKKRAPAPVRALRLEWLWRMIREPHRMKNIPEILDFLSLERMERRGLKKRNSKGGFVGR